MIDTFHPLHLTRQAVDLEDDRYPYSWIPPEDHERARPRALGARPGGLPGLRRRY